MIVISKSYGFLNYRAEFSNLINQSFSMHQWIEYLVNREVHLSDSDLKRDGPVGQHRASDSK